MTKEEVVKMMLDSINADNREICVRGGMSEEDINAQVEQSQQALIFMLSNVYEKLKDAQLLA